MLNTKKILYILPDLTYVAELLPAKKEHTFSIQSFKQINGEFINDNEFLPASIEKLFSKLEKEEYHLILPDFLFINTIVSVEGTSKTTVLEHVEKKLLPDLKLSKDTHDIELNVLTSFKGNSKVQISAIEKSILAPLRAMVKKTDVKISAVSSLSWSIKAIVSLEPSITVLQMGSILYAAQHYIGVDQASNFPLDKYDSIVETIKTLKGAEPSIQSVYLASSALVEDNIKDKLSETLPIQQLATYKEEDTKMPSYIKFIIESTMRTLSISDFPVPKFELGKPTEEDLKSISSSKTKIKEEVKEEDTKQEDLPEPTKKEIEIEKPSEDETKQEEETSTSSKTVEPAQSDLPAPAIAPVVTPELGEDTKEEPMAKDDKKEKEEELPSIPEIDTTSEESKDEDAQIKPLQEEKDEQQDKEVVKEEDTKKETKTEETESEDTPKDEPKKEEKGEIDLSQFVSKDTTKEDKEDGELAIEKDDDATPGKADIPSIKNIDKSEKKVIKNSSGVNNMLKMVFITIAVFFITIAIGVGVGLGLLKMSDKQPEETTPVVVSETPESPEPTQTPTPTPEVVEINKDDLSILVVNATTKAGYAGTVKGLLEDAEITDVTAANAKGEYSEGTDYLLLTEENQELQKLLEESTDLTFQTSMEIDVEDSASKYDAVIVLAK